MTRQKILSRSPIMLFIAFAVAAATFVIAHSACTEPGTTPRGVGDTRPAALQQYADCWADTAKSQDAVPPAHTFNTADASMLRCRHLQPGADHWLDHFKTGGRLPVPRYKYTVADHQECLTSTVAWFRDRHPHAGASHPHLFSEIVCAVPPPVYTNVPDD